MKARGLLLASGAAAAAGVGLCHAAPAATTWRGLRCTLSPRLAGIGDADHVALTFDDGPDPAATPGFLDELDRLGWRATFFLLGSMVRAAPGLAAEIVARGHEVGVHGDAHVSHLHRRRSEVIGDAQRSLDTIAAATGADLRWFRPPYGTLSGGSIAAAHRLGLETVLWTTWGRDWRPVATARSIVDDVARGLRPGATVLLHDSDCTSSPGSWRATLASLDGLSEVFDRAAVRVGPLAEHGLR